MMILGLLFVVMIFHNPPSCRLYPLCSIDLLHRCIPNDSIGHGFASVNLIQVVILHHGKIRPPPPLWIFVIIDAGGITIASPNSTEYPLPKESTLRNSPPSDKTEKCTRCVQGIPSYRIYSLDESCSLDQLLIGSAPPPSFRH